LLEIKTLGGQPPGVFAASDCPTWILMMSAIRSATSQARQSLRYYLWSDDGPWRLSERFHAGLVSGTVNLKQYANTKQKIVEVFVRRHRGQPIFVKARGIYYRFDKSGRLDVTGLSEAAAIALEGSRPRHVAANLFDVSPAIRHRRWLKAQTWRVDAAILRKITADLNAESQSLTEDRIPMLKHSRR
jgi:hypothetical protein